MTDAHKLLGCLFSPGDWIEFRSIRPGAGGKVHEWHRLGDEIGGTLERLRVANDTDHAFFGANPRRDRGGSKAVDVLCARSLFVDFDRSLSGEKRCSVVEATGRIREAFLPVPTAVVSTGNGCHAYWRLEEAIGDLDIWSRIQKALIRMLRTDASIHDAPRCMRLPGFANVKYSHRPVAALAFGDPEREYSIAEFPDPVEARQVGSSTTIEQGSRSELSRRFLEEGFVLPAGRRATIFTVACDLSARGWSLEGAESAIMERVERLDLEPGEIDDVPRQIRNAFAVARSPVEDEPVRVVPAARDLPPEPQGPATVDREDRLIDLSQAISIWRDQQEDEAVKVAPLFETLMPSGLPRGQIVCLAAEPGVGKTAIALQLATSALANDPNLSVLWCLGEMTPARLAERAIAQATPMHLDDVRERSKTAVDAAARVADRIGSRLHILQSPLYSGEIAEAIDRTGAAMCVVDYLQLVRVRELRTADRRQEVDRALLDLRHATTSRRVAMVLISNLAKSVSHNERPNAMDIGKESSEIGFQVDVVLYGRMADDGGKDSRYVDWRCLKNRHGVMQDCELEFKPGFQSFLRVGMSNTRGQG